MKTLKEYFQDLGTGTTVEPDNIMEDGIMRPLKKYAQVDIIGAEGLYETNVDRWSRNAKHHLAKSEIVNAADQPIYEVGDIVLYEDQEVTVKIPQGPKNTVGVIVEGHLKMIHQTKISKIDENVVGGLQSISPLNRIMQLAGLEHTGAVSSDPITEDEMLEETDATGVINQLLIATQNMPEYKGNEEAARLYAYGSILSEIFNQLNANKLQTVQGQNAMTDLTRLGGIGAELIKTAQSLSQGQKPGAAPAATTTVASPAQATSQQGPNQGTTT